MDLEQLCKGNESDTKRVTSHDLTYMKSKKLSANFEGPIQLFGYIVTNLEECIRNFVLKSRIL